MKSHANRGKNWEGIIDALHYIYEAQGIALCLRTPPNMRIIRAVKGGQFLAYFEKEGPPDYMIIHKGIPIMAEAKDCAQKRFSFKKIPYHQAQRLGVCDTMGGVACVLLRHTQSGTKWVIPWRNMSPKWWAWWRGSIMKKQAKKGTASLTLDEIRIHGIEWDSTGYLKPLLKSIKLNQEE